jgi:hypothetical protein
VVGENVSLAIVDAATEPVEESGLRPTSRYLASVANMPLIWHVFDELAKGGGGARLDHRARRCAT